MATQLPTGPAKIFAYKVQPGLNQLPGASGAQILRRVQGWFEPEKDTFQSDENEPTFQLSDLRHGTRRSKGTFKGRMSCGTFKDFYPVMCRQAWQTAPSTTAITTVTAAASGPQFSRSAGSFITDGFRVGQVVQWTGWASTATANNNRYFQITALTATNMTGVFLDGTAVAAKAAGDSVTCTLAGRQTWIPQSGHTKLYIGFEEYHPDLAVTASELTYDAFINSATITFDPKGFTGFDMALQALSLQNQTSQYFTSPTAVTTSGLHGGVDGTLYMGGTAVANVTGGQIQLATGNTMADPVFGSNVAPDYFPGMILPTGNLSIYWTDVSARDAFLNETPSSFIGTTRAGRGAQSDTMGFVIPLLKYTGASKSDDMKGIVRGYPFTAINNKTGTGPDQTSFAIQDTLAP